MKVCIVGFGAIAPVHANHLVNTQGAELYAVCDIVKERADAAAHKYGTKAYYDFETCLKDAEIECVHICTPHYLHFEMIEKALEKGKYVVCEKPITMTKNEFEKLRNLKDCSKVCVVMQNRLNPCIDMLKSIAEDGRYGKIKTLKGILTWKRTKEYYANELWRGKIATEGGGVLINQAIHMLDFFTYIAGRVRSVKASVANFSLDSIEVEDTAVARLEFDDGIKGIFFATNGYGEDSPFEFEVLFEEGRVCYRGGKLFLNDRVICEDKKAVIGKSYWGESHRKLIERFYNEGKYFGVEDVKDTMYTLFAIYESANSDSKRIEL